MLTSKESKKKYRERNKVKIKAYNKAYQEENKVKLKANRESNKEKLKISSKKYRKENKVKIAADKKIYWDSPEGKRSLTISRWKYRGLQHPDIGALYDEYLLSTICEVCEIPYKKITDRCMDHDHDTGLFRQFLCRNCNNFDRWKTKV